MKKSSKKPVKQKELLRKGVAINPLAISRFRPIRGRNLQRKYTHIRKKYAEKQCHSAGKSGSELYR